MNWRTERQRLINRRSDGVICDMLLVMGFLLALGTVTSKW